MSQQTFGAKGAENMQRKLFWALLVAAVAFGLLIAYVDSRPHWDDTGITVGSILLVSGLLGLALPGRAWVWALAVGGWIPLVEIGLQGGGAGPLVALAVACVGAYGGAFARRGIESVGRAGEGDPHS
jgi:hypothetical protein